MPINATPEFALAQKRFLEAKTRDEKIFALEEMIKFAPKHKGGDKLLAELKTKLSKLRAKTEGKKGSRAFALKKEGDMQICLIGLTQSGKSTLLSELTNARPKISSVNYTTVKPEMGVAEWTGVKIQLVEIPSTFEPHWLSIAQSSDGIIFVYDGAKNLAEQKEKLSTLAEKFHLRQPSVEVVTKKQKIFSEKLFSELWEKLNLIRIYTKQPDRPPEKKALVLRERSNVRRACFSVHKDFVKHFKFARVWGSAKIPGERVGLEYVLRDGDVLEIHA
ncbi:MAG TPA: GTPase [archaeon]|nr:GTPase [archaeon]